MDRKASPPILETSQLLSQLDQDIDQSDLMRDIFNRWERLHRIEVITGPSRCTRVMRQEIEIMESKLKSARNF
jgi:hypothetical protein